MATYTSAATGNWSAGATWVGGVKPPSAAGHKIVIAAGHTVTYDEASGEYGDDTSSSTVANNAIVVNGTLKASRSMSTTLTCRGTLAVATGTLDWGTEADPIPSSYNAILELNYSASLAAGKHGLYSNGGDPVKYLFCGVQRTRNTTLTGNVSIGATSITVAAATNWAVGDTLALMSNDNDPANSEIVTVSSVSGLTIGISATSKAHNSGLPVGNLSSNVLVRSYSSAHPSFIHHMSSVSSTTAECKFVDTALWHLGHASSWVGISVSQLYQCALCIRTISANEGLLKVVRCGFYNTAASVNYALNFPSCQFGVPEVTDVAIWGNSTAARALRCSGGGSANITGFWVYSSAQTYNMQSDGALVLRITGGHTVGVRTLYSDSNVDALFSNMTKLCTSNFWQGYNGNFRFSNCTIGSTGRLYEPLQAGLKNVFTFFNCTFTGNALTGDISQAINGAGNRVNPECAFTLIAVNGSSSDNRVRSYWHETASDTSTKRKSTYSVKISPKYANASVKYIFTIPAVSGVAQTIKPALRWDTNYVGSGLVKPVLTLSGQGVSQSFTPSGSSVDTWYDTTLTYTPTSTGDITVTVTVQSSNTTGFVWLDGLWHYPMTQSVRHFGYQFLPQSSLVADSTITLSESAALALPVAVNHGTSTITISGNCTTREIYEACMADLCATANQGTAVHITPLQSGASFSTTYDVIINGGVSITGNFVDASGTRVKIVAPNIVSGSRVQLYNLDTSTELLNTVIGSGGVSLRLTWTADQEIRLRADHADKLALEVTGLLTSNGLTFLNTQEADTVYTGNAIDGSTVTEFDADEPNVQIDLDDPDGVTTWQRLYAWFQYWQTTSAGIASSMFGALAAQDAANYLIDQDKADIRFDNVSGSPLVIGGGYGRRADGTTLIAATSDSIQMDPGRAYIPAGSAGSGATAAEVWAYSSRTLTADPGAAAHATTQSVIAGVPAAVRSNLTTELGRIDVAISTREAESAAASRASTNQTEHDATQSAIAALPAAPAAATVAGAVRTELTTELGRLDAAVSTRLAAASYAAPLDAAGVRSAVGLAAANLDTQLAGLPTDADVQAATAAALTAYGPPTAAELASVQSALVAEHDATQSAIAALPAAPAAATVASAVRSELTTELGRLDAAVSTRLASAGYTAPPAAATVATAVRSELATELGRLDVAVGTRLPTASYTAPLDAAATRAAVGLAAANLDTQLGALPTDADVQAAAAAALTAYDAATGADVAAVPSAPSATTVASAVRAELSTELARMDASVSSRAAPGAAMTLTTGERTAVAAAVEAAILMEGDGQAVIDAIVQAIGNSNVDELALVAAIRADLERVGGMLAGVPAGVRTELSTELARVDVAVSTRLAAAGYTAPLDAAATRAAVGLAAGNLDTQLAGLPTDADVQTAVAAALAAYGAAAGADVPSAAAVASAVLAAAVESGFSVQRVLRIIAAAVAGKTSGGPSGFVARDLTDSRNQITGTADDSGNRSSASYGA